MSLPPHERWDERMTTTERCEVSLEAALRAYVEARNTALVEARKSLGLGELDAKALLFLAAHPDTRPSELRGYLGITSAGVTTLTDRLIAKGAVTRVIDANDRRSSFITVVIDLDAEPWSVLTRFDRELSASLAETDPEATAAFSRILTAAVVSAEAVTVP